jgi:hypothetical protein
MKDNMEQSTADLLTEAYLEPSQNPTNEDDVVVDAVDTVPPSYDKEFVIAPGQILGLDQAVLQSIDRCRKFRLRCCQCDFNFVSSQRGSQTKNVRMYFNRRGWNEVFRYRDLAAKSNFLADSIFV